MIFNIKYSLIDHHPFSLSWITGQTELITYIAVTTTISYFISLVFFVIITKLHKKSTLDISRQLILLTITTTILVSLPVFVSFVINGPIVTWTLPEMQSMYVAFLALMQILILAILGIFITGLSAPIQLLVRRNSGAN
jgi:hypothetical protein